MGMVVRNERKGRDGICESNDRKGCEYERASSNDTYNRQSEGGIVAMG